MKFIQWTLFLAVAFGTLACVLTFGPGSGARGLAFLFGGLSASIYVLFFVPFSTQFYLSELLAITLVFGTEMTLLVNLGHEPLDAFKGFASLVVAFATPIVLFFVLNWRRPEEQRFLKEKARLPRVPPSNEYLRRAAVRFMWFFGLGVAFGIGLLVVDFWMRGPRYNVMEILVPLWMLNFYTNWRLYKKAKAQLSAEST